MIYIKIIFNKLPNKFKNKKSLILIIFIVAAFLVSIRGGADEDLIETVVAKKGTIKSEVFATGKIESVNDSSLNFAVSGKVVWIPFSEGDLIKKGQAIAQLDKELFEIDLRKKEQEHIAVEAFLERVYDSLDDDPVESFDDKVNRTAAEADKNQAFDDIKQAKRNLQNTVLTSPISGTLVDLNIKVGDEILSTETVARVADIENLQFTAKIDEADIGSIKVGQESTIFLEAFPEDEINASVVSIGFEGELTATDATVFDVKFQIEPNEKFILGMNGDVQITIQEKANVLVVPVEALFDENKIWVKVNGNYFQKNAEVGIQNDLEVEIITGSSEGEEVVVAGFEEIGKKSLIQKFLP